MISSIYKGKKVNNNLGSDYMKKIYLSLFIAILFLLPLVNASLGTFKPGDVVPIRVLSNCSSVNITEVNGVLINKVMTNLGGQTWNYSYTLIGDAKAGMYSYSWNPNCVDCGADECGNSFEVTPSGFTDTLGFYIVLLIILGLVITLGFSIKEGWFVVIGGMGLIILGLYSVINGIAGFKDMFMTWAISLFLIGTGTFLSIKSTLEMMDIELS